MNLFFPKKYIIIYIFIISFSLLKSQNDTFFQEKKLFNEYVINYNNTVSNLKYLNERLDSIKYHFLFIIKYNSLKKSNKAITKLISKIYNELNSSSCDKNKINEELNELNITLTEFDIKCNKLIDSYNTFDFVKENVISKIKRFLNVFIILAIILFIIIGIISIYLVKRQKRYRKIREDYSHDDSYDNDRDSLRDFYKLKVKNDENYSDSRDLSGKKKKKHNKRIIKFV